MEVIEEKLSNCDQFVVLLSSNFMSSPYCMVELGFAYARLVQRKTAIKPWALPGAEDLLKRTPLDHLIVRPVLDMDTLQEYKKDLMEKGIAVKIDNDGIRNFERRLTSAYLANADVFEHADIRACCSDPQKPDAVKCMRSGDSVVVNFNLYSDGKETRPDFISTVVHFYNILDLYSLYSANYDLKLQCTIENYTNSLEQIQIELQSEGNCVVGEPFSFDLNPQFTEIEIPIERLSKYRKGLQKIQNICFVAKGTTFIETEGSYTIKNLALK